jgi:hypothetical protein
MLAHVAAAEQQPRILDQPKPFQQDPEQQQTSDEGDEREREGTTTHPVHSDTWARTRATTPQHSAGVSKRPQDTFAGAHRQLVPQVFTHPELEIDVRKRSRLKSTPEDLRTTKVLWTSYARSQRQYEHVSTVANLPLWTSVAAFAGVIVPRLGLAWPGWVEL